MTTNPTGPDLTEEPTIGRLIADASGDISALIRSEIELAKTELRFSVKAGGLGAAMFGAAAFLLVLASVLISISFGYFLVWLDFHPALAFLTVFGAYVLVAAVLGFVGYRKVKQVRAPEKAIEAVKLNKEAFKHS